MTMLEIMTVAIPYLAFVTAVIALITACAANSTARKTKNDVAAINNGLHAMGKNAFAKIFAQAGQGGQGGSAGGEGRGGDGGDGGGVNIRR
jgi:uncharacterized membrane protein YgcG